MIARARVVERAFLDAGHRIALFRVGEGKGRRRELAQRGGRRPSPVEVDPRGAGDVRHHGIEHLAVALVGIEALIEKIAEESAALRGAERVGVFRRGDRVGRVLEPRRGIPHGDESQTGNRRIRGGVRQLVGAARLEPALERDDVARQLPLVARDRGRRALDPVADGQRVPRRRGIARRVAAQISDREFRTPRIGRERRADDTGHAGRRRHVDPDRAVALRHVELPADPHDREALPHQQAVAELGVRRQVAGRGGAVESGEDGPAAAVDDVDERDAVPVGRVLRLEDREVGAELDEPGGVARRLVEIGDDLVARALGIDDEVDASDDQLVAAGRTEGAPAEHVPARGDVDARHFGGGEGRQEGQDGHARRSVVFEP